MFESGSEISGRKILGVRLAAIMEILAFLFIACLLNYVFGKGDRFASVSPHPFWIIVLLVTVQYGTAEGIFAALASTLVLYAGHIPMQKVDEPYFDYQLRLGLLPALWFITAFVLGELRMRLDWENSRLKAEYTHAKSAIEKITAEYLALKETNQNLGIQLSGQEETAATSFKVLHALEALEPAQIITGINAIINLSLHPEKFSVFAKGPNGFEAVTSEGWTSTDNFTRRFPPAHPLFEAVAIDKRMLLMINKDDQHILKKEGLIAAPLIDPETGETFAMIKVEAIDFQSMNLSRIESFRVICDLIGKAYSNAKKHRKFQESSLSSIPGLLYSHVLYSLDAQALGKFASALGFTLSSIRIQLLKDKIIDEALLKDLQKSMPGLFRVYEGPKRRKEVIILCLSSKNVDLEKTIGTLLAKNAHLQKDESAITVENLNHKTGLSA